MKAINVTSVSYNN